MVLGHTDLAGLPRWVSGKESTCQCRRPGFNPWIEKNPWRMATYSSILSWKIPWTKEPGRLQSMGLQRIGDDLATECMHTHTHAHTHAHTHTRTDTHTHAHAHTRTHTHMHIRTGLVAPWHVGSSWIRDQTHPLHWRTDS